MKKYIYIFKTQVMSNLQYVFNIVLSFIGGIIMLYILFNLWRYLYSDPNQLINGYSMSQMTWYVIITEVLWMTLSGRKYCKKISEDVKSGNITYNINKPYDYIGYCLATHLGEMAVKGAIIFSIGLVLGFIFLGTFPTLNLAKFLIVLLSMILASTISTLLVIFLGLFSFFIEDAGPLWWLYSKFILVLGTIFPIEYFPIFLQKILNYSPVYVVSYGPAKLFVDFSYSRALYVIIAQIIYIGISYLICRILYRKGVRNINVNGG